MVPGVPYLKFHLTEGGDRGALLISCASLIAELWASNERPCFYTYDREQLMEVPSVSLGPPHIHRSQSQWHIPVFQLHGVWSWRIIWAQEFKTSLGNVRLGLKTAKQTFNGSGKDRTNTTVSNPWATHAAPAGEPHCFDIPFVLFLCSCNYLQEMCAHCPSAFLCFYTGVLIPKQMPCALYNWGNSLCTPLQLTFVSLLNEPVPEVPPAFGTWL